MRWKKLTSRPSPDDAAAAWLVRRDRGLSPREQDEYLQWLRADARHAAAIARAEATLRRVLQLSAWRHEHSAEPNPDLLARRRHPPRWRMPVVALAAAAAVAWGVYFRLPPGTPASPPRNYLRVNETAALPDGSSAKLRDGTRLEVRYAANERRVRLTGGEAEFSVREDSTRPFIVEAAGIAVRALGTVFTVRLGGEAVEVLVTKGKVRVDPAAPTRAEPEKPAVVTAGQRALVPLADATAPVVADVSPEEVRDALAWQAPRLQFDETPLADAIAEFNRRNRHQLTLGDAALGSVPIGGIFRPDNIEGFVRVLTVTLGVRAEPRGPDETVLRRPR